MMKIASLLMVAAAATVSARAPVFAQEWTAVVTQHVAINQGGEPGADGSICCDYTSPGCKVQTIHMAGRQYFDQANNRTAFFATNGAGVVTLYNEAKEYSVGPDGACQSFCPTEGGFEAFGLGGNITHEAPSTYNGKSCEEYTVPTIIPVLNVTMQTDMWYVVLNGTTGPDTPLADISYLTPFGENLGTTTSIYGDYVIGAPDASKFVVTGKAQCKQAKNCNGSSSSKQHEEEGMDAARILRERGAKIAGQSRPSALLAELYELDA